MLNKLQNIIHTYNIDEWLCVIILILSIIIVYRIFTTVPTPMKNMSSYTNLYKHENIHEGFESFMPSNVIYGNEIIPSYSTNQNTCTFSFPSVFRLDTIRIYFTHTDAMKLPTDVSATLQYINPNGNTESIVNDVNTMSTKITVDFDGIDNFIKIIPVLNSVSGQAVYTNQLILTVGDTNSSTKLNDFIKYYDFYGRNREDLTYAQFHSQLSTTAKNIAPTNFTKSGSINKLSLDKDYLIYSMKLSLDDSTYPNFAQYSADTPFALTVQYTTSIYPSQTLQINDSILTRCDKHSFNIESPHIIYIYFSTPLIANSIVISAPSISVSSVTSSTATPSATIPNIQFALKSTANLHSIYGIVPSTNDITNFQRTAQMASTSNSGGTSNDVCPSMNDMIQKQMQAQQLCDSIEIQDKIKSEQIKLDKNNQYLIKLKAQQDQIDQLNQAITQLNTTRTSRDKSADMARVVRYQNQKSSANTVRDLANQRLQSQDANNLHLNVNIN